MTHWWQMLDRSRWETLEDFARGERIIARTALAVIVVGVLAIFLAALTVPSECSANHAAACAVIHRVSQVVAGIFGLVTALVLLDYIRR